MIEAKSDLGGLDTLYPIATVLFGISNNTNSQIRGGPRAEVTIVT